VTREHKLALIVGFSLILLVGVLISDHLSRARQAKIVPVGTGEAQIAEVRPIDPLRNQDGVTPIQATSPVQVVQQTQVAPPAPIVNTPGTTTGTLASGVEKRPLQTPGFSGNESQQGHQWINPRPGTTAMGGQGQGDDALRIEAAKLGGSIDGSTIYLPSGSETLPPAPVQAPVAVKAEPKAPPAALVENVKFYTVQKGDTLLKISQANYGSAKLWHELAKYNSISENGLRLGAKIKLPTKEALTGKPEPVKATATASKLIPPSSPSTTGTPAAPATTKSLPAKTPASLPAKTSEIRYATYTVKPGDTLGHISQRVLGTSKRTQDIIDLNKLDDEDSIPVGTVLRMPIKG
jgi:nucleoid-associated protein YgaU